MFIRSFHGMHEHLSTAEILKTIRQKHDESLWDYVKHFCNARNAIRYIQDIEIINAFCDGGSDIKTVDEITIKKPKTVVDLLIVADVCIEASEARARLLESHGKGSSKKKHDNWEVNATDHGDYRDHKEHGDHEYRGNCQQQSSKQKEKRPFHWPVDAEKWCEIHHTVRHGLEECKTFLDRKTMPPPAAPVAQEPRRGEYHWADPDNEDQMEEINVIFGRSMSIASKTYGKKLEREISLARCIEPRRKMKWSDMDISFGLEDHLETELSDRNLPFVVNLPIGRHKVAKLLIDNGASLNLITRKSFIKMGLNLKDLTPVHDMFHGIIPGQSSTPIGQIDLNVSYETGDNKCKDMLMFEVASFDFGYNCIIRRSFLLKFMVVTYTFNAMMKMLGPKGVIIINTDQRDALVCENATLTHGGWFDE
jgi:hypothetical protein